MKEFYHEKMSFMKMFSWLFCTLIADRNTLAVPSKSHGNNCFQFYRLANKLILYLFQKFFKYNLLSSVPKDHNHATNATFWQKSTK